MVSGCDCGIGKLAGIATGRRGVDMRLIDRLRRDDPDPEWSRRDEMPVIVADEIGAYIDSLPETTSSPTAESYGCVAPPFETFFVECVTMIRAVPVYLGLAVGVVRNPRGAGVGVAVPDGTHWQLGLTGYAWRREWPGVRGHSGIALLHLDREGYLLDDMKRVTCIQAQEAAIGNLPLASLPGYIPFAMMAISKMHQRCEVEYVVPTRQQRRYAGRKHGVDPASYYYLNVRPESRRYVGSGSRGAHRPNREHAVRGHFRYYTEERPLFGRFSGMVWVSAHTRGREEYGRIEKGYLVGGQDE